MRHYDRPAVALAVCLSMLAGYIDAIGFLGMGGFFISFMSGNSTRFGVGLAGGDWRVAMTAGGLILFFVIGVMAGTGLARRVAPGRRPRVVLLLVAALLALAGIGPFGAAATMLILAAAMGAENAVFERDNEVSIGLTYMTGTLVRLGQNLVNALFFGGPPFGWARYLLLWAGLAAGTVAGAMTYAAIGLSGVWFGAAVALLLAGAVRTAAAD
ncbi:MAG: hypothetical protein ABS87_03745 [Sphingomonas sp. SCN 67-18]|uniref:YoaK family protein n=1 Tax=uncultured Sphingomonas sp. TaxID=158754 RepID=UPI0008689BB4|nr:YoaK family protein [Sphingomonas sp. SCN 67-18]ODU22149.1 MAG: hypothetical protein ABS87_03745 [Sphingomonas sp. SCN 67-18]